MCVCVHKNTKFNKSVYNFKKAEFYRQSLCGNMKIKVFDIKIFLSFRTLEDLVIIFDTLIRPFGKFWLKFCFLVSMLDYKSQSLR